MYTILCICLHYYSQKGQNAIGMIPHDADVISIITDDQINGEVRIGGTDLLEAVFVSTYMLSSEHALVEWDY